MNPAASGGRDLPLTMYEERTHVVGDQASSEFVKTEYTVQADEAERITVSYCARVVSQEEAGSAGQRKHRNERAVRLCHTLCSVSRRSLPSAIGAVSLCVCQ